jgi:hypothetical protein
MCDNGHGIIGIEKKEKEIVSVLSNKAFTI